VYKIVPGAVRVAGGSFLHRKGKRIGYSFYKEAGLRAFHLITYKDSIIVWDSGKCNMSINLILG
jgi:hypothetical protein